MWSLKLLVALVTLERAHALVPSPVTHSTTATPTLRRLSPPLHAKHSRAPHPNLKKGDDLLDDDARARMRAVGSNDDFGSYRRIESTIYLFGGIITIVTPIVLGIWAYNEGYLTPQ